MRTSHSDIEAAAPCCHERQNAQRDGELYYHPIVLGWVWPATNRTTPLPVFTLDFCPFCNASLPGAERRTERAMELVTHGYQDPPRDASGNAHDE